MSATAVWEFGEIPRNVCQLADGIQRGAAGGAGRGGGRRHLWGAVIVIRGVAGARDAGFA